MEILNCELSEALGHQVLFALGRHSLEPGSGREKEAVMGSSASRAGAQRGQPRGGEWPSSLARKGSPSPIRSPAYCPASGRTAPSRCRGRREPHKPFHGTVTHLLQHPSTTPSPLQFLAVIQQRLQVGEPESSIEAVPVGPGLADVRVLFVEVLQRQPPAPAHACQHQAGQAKEAPDKGHTTAVATEFLAATC